MKFCTIGLIRYAFIFLTGAFPLFTSNESYLVGDSTLLSQNVKEENRIGKYFILLMFLFPNVIYETKNSFMSFPFIHAKTINENICGFGIVIIWFIGIIP